jgi:hypothetical protein
MPHAIFHQANRESSGVSQLIMRSILNEQTKNRAPLPAPEKVNREHTIARRTGRRNNKPNISSSMSAMLSVYDGRQPVGFVLPRGKVGFEAFDRDEQSRGLFGKQELAIAALSTAGAPA